MSNVPTLANPKSRGNFAPGAGLSDEQWQQIFGSKKTGYTQGNAPKDKPARGDYEMCRKLDEHIIDYTRYKDEKTRAKIKENYFSIQESYRKKAQNRN